MRSNSSEQSSTPSGHWTTCHDSRSTTYPVEDDDSLVEKSPVLFGRQSHVVEEAEAEGLAVFSVVTRGPDQTQTVTETAGADCKTRSVKIFQIVLSSDTTFATINTTV